MITAQLRIQRTMICAASAQRYPTDFWADQLGLLVAYAASAYFDTSFDGSSARQKTCLEPKQDDSWQCIDPPLPACKLGEEPIATP